MAGFLKQKRQARQWANTNGYSNASGDFDSAYNAALQQVRDTGLRGMKARREALFNAMQNMKSKSEEAWENPEENVGQDTAYAALQKRYNLGSTPVGPRDNDENLDAFLSLHGINSPAQRNTPVAAQPAQIQESQQEPQQAQTPTGETVKVASTAATPAQPATVGPAQQADATVETPAPGQPAQIQAPAVKEEQAATPVQEKYKGQKDYDNLTFGQAFGQAMKDLGEGKIFYYKGKPIKLVYDKTPTTKEDTTKKEVKADAAVKTESPRSATTSEPYNKYYNPKSNRANLYKQYNDSFTPEEWSAIQKNPDYHRFLGPTPDPLSNSYENVAQVFNFGKYTI